MKHTIKMISFVYQYGDIPEECVALFDERDLSQPEVEELLRSESYDPRLIVVSKLQYETVFRSLMQQPEQRKKVLS